MTGQFRRQYRQYRPAGAGERGDGHPDYTPAPPPSAREHGQGEALQALRARYARWFHEAGALGDVQRLQELVTQLGRPLGQSRRWVWRGHGDELRLDQDAEGHLEVRWHSGLVCDTGRAYLRPGPWLEAMRAQWTALQRQRLAQRQLRLDLGDLGPELER